MFEFLSDKVLQYRKIILVLLLIVTPLLALYSLPPLDNSFDIWLEPTDPTFQAYLAYRELFESEEFLILAFRSEDIFTTDSLSLIHRLGQGLLGIEGIERVMSLTNMEDIRTSPSSGTVEINPLVGEEIPSDPLVLAEIRDRALGNPLCVGNLISEDGKTAAVYGVVNDRDVTLRRKIQVDVHALVNDEESRTGKKIYISGNPYLDAEFERMSQEDNVKFTVITMLMVMTVLYILYRSAAGVLMPLLVVSVATTWAMGIYGLMGNKMNLLTIMMPAVILAISVADAVHLMCQYNDEHLEGVASNREALRRTLNKVGYPCLFTSLTTAIGFGSFVISKIGPVRLQGIYTALGIMLAFTMTVTMLPAILSFLRPPRLEHREGPRGDLVSHGLQMALRVVNRHPRVVFWVGVLVLLVSLAGMSMLKRESNAIEFFKKSSEVRTSLDFIEKNLTGIFSVEILLKGPPDSMKDPEVLHQVEKLREIIGARPVVTKTFHLNDLIKEMNRAMHEGDNRFYAVPSSSGEVAQYLLLYEISGGEELDTLVNIDYSQARISARSEVMTAEKGKELISILDEVLEELFDGPVEASTTGIIPIWVQTDVYLLQSMIQSFCIAAFGIFLMMCILLRSVPMGLLSMIPNLLPIIVTMGAMGWTGIRLDTATIMITSVAIGIAVDDTIHFLARFQMELKACGDYDEAIRRTMMSVGRAIVFTSIILFWGFISLTLGHFKPTIYFGFLTGMTMMVALVGDVFLLPVLLKIFRPVKV